MAFFIAIAPAFPVGVQTTCRFTLRGAGPFCETRCDDGAAVEVPHPLGLQPPTWRDACDNSEHEQA